MSAKRVVADSSSFSQRSRSANVYTAEQAGRLLGVDRGTVIRWVEAGLLCGSQTTAGAPWRVRLTEEDRRRLTAHTFSAYNVSFHDLKARSWEFFQFTEYFLSDSGWLRAGDLMEKARLFNLCCCSGRN